MANLKTKKTAAGAQQYTTKKGMASARKTLEPDIKKFIDGDMTREEFKKKHGVHPLKASSMLYAGLEAELSDRNTKKGNLYFADRLDKAEKTFSDTGKRYNKGGYVKCGASVPATQKNK
tara:strand:- start:70 stop:426 length:357 start_codon:yes stop_codon:yes gene_type:complete